MFKTPNYLRIVTKPWFVKKSACIGRAEKDSLVTAISQTMNNVKSKPPTLGVIYGNRDFFPDQLVTEARAEIAGTFARLGLRSVQLGEGDSKLGGVETHADARKCAELFRNHAGEIDGVLVCLPNFGDEKGVADTFENGKSERAGVDPRLSRRFEAAFARAPERCVLREDFRLQQSSASRNQIFTNGQTRFASGLGQLFT